MRYLGVILVCAVRSLTALLLVGLSTGCVMLYAPMAAPPGRYLPPASKGEGDFAVDIPIGRNLAYGIGIESDGSLVASNDNVPIWPGIDLAFRYGLTESIGLDARITSSLLIPFPVPIPNGATLAPIFKVLEDEAQTLSLHVSPRVLWINGLTAVSGPGTSKETRYRSAGLEVPLLFDYGPARWFDLMSTVFVRAFYTRARIEEVSNSGETINTSGGWPSFGGGITVAAIFTAGRFRMSLGLGLEAAPNPVATRSPGDGAVLFFPQGGLSLGTAWE